MRPKTYAVLVRAVEEGVASGWRRAHKHVEQPAEQDVRDAIEGEVLSSICEWFELDEPEHERGA